MFLFSIVVTRISLDCCKFLAIILLKWDQEFVRRSLKFECKISATFVWSQCMQRYFNDRIISYLYVHIIEYSWLGLVFWSSKCSYLFSVVALVIDVNSCMSLSNSQNPTFLGLVHRLPHLSSNRSPILLVLASRIVGQPAELHFLEGMGNLIHPRFLIYLPENSMFAYWGASSWLFMFCMLVQFLVWPSFQDVWMLFRHCQFSGYW